MRLPRQVAELKSSVNEEGSGATGSSWLVGGAAGAHALRRTSPFGPDVGSIGAGPTSSS
jgi:hypothetical protein